MFTRLHAARSDAGTHEPEAVYEFCSTFMASIMSSFQKFSRFAAAYVPFSSRVPGLVAID
eukprot:2410589-Pleurochrysis_carterae.AAC.2